ncbi:MAG: hypothetical protein IT373_17010 [Polyangiaceae bacterium]|nr:hypothetical protein [Polyangiaceae bacterium]
MRCKVLAIQVVLAAAAWSGCGGDKPTVKEPAPTATPAPLPPPTVTASAEPEPSAAQSASAAPTQPKPSGRPSIMMTGDKEISSTFGSSPGAVLSLHGADGDATLKIPEYALRGAINLVMRFENAGKGFGTTLGRIVSITPQDAEAATPTPTSAESAGPPFELRLPTYGKDTVNLAVGMIADEGGKQKITWTVYAPKSVDATKKLAYFEITKLAPSYVHVTTSPPTEPKP